MSTGSTQSVASQKRAKIVISDYFTGDTSFDNLSEQPAIDDKTTGNQKRKISQVDSYEFVDDSNGTIDLYDIKYKKAVGKRKDCADMVFTTDEKNLYGKNRQLQNGDIAYLCRLYGSLKCKSRLYMRAGRLFKKSDFIQHNHDSQENDQFEFQVEFDIKSECANLNALVNTGSQKAAVTDIFEKHVRE